MIKLARYFSSIVLFAGVLSCQSENETPPGIIPKNKMISFLIDLHIAEARINDLSLRRDSAEAFFKEVEDSLYAKNGISHDSIYQKSYEYYLRDVNGLDAIYSAVVDSLSLRERLVKEKEALKVEKEEDKDSISIVEKDSLISEEALKIKVDKK